MIYIHVMAIVTQVLYTMYNIVAWHTMMFTDYAKAHWASRRSNFVANYKPSTEGQRDREQWSRNQAAGSRWTFWGKGIHKMYVDNLKNK